MNFEEFIRPNESSEQESEIATEEEATEVESVPEILQKGNSIPGYTGTERSTD